MTALGAGSRRQAGYGGLHGSGRRLVPTGWVLVPLLVLVGWLAAPLVHAQAEVPELTGPVNDFASVIDAKSAGDIDQMSRALLQASGDAVVVATIDTYAPFADIREYAVKLFENHGKGIGEKGKHNGLLILLAVKDHKVWVEVGYGLEEFITDGYAGETSREVMIPAFRTGGYGPGLVAGVARLVGRIAQARRVTLEGVPAPEPTRPRKRGVSVGSIVFIAIILLLMLIRRGGSGPSSRYRGGWGGGGWSGWSSGIGSFGGGGGGGFGGGFGGFGGGGSGGGGGGGSW
ncbi:MAG TPA: TPM domain-containing protein [Vicinamibacterales bacterium]